MSKISIFARVINDEMTHTYVIYITIYRTTLLLHSQRCLVFRHLWREEAPCLPDADSSQSCRIRSVTSTIYLAKIPMNSSN